ncbi:MAG: hypothetical protein ACE5DN_00465 [Flavobacteriales bacterium]
MNQVFRFRVLIDHPDDVFRDIDLYADSSFEDFHKIIVKAFEFDGSQLASFYMSNESWDKGDEITLMKMDPEIATPNIQVMSETLISDKVSGKGEKLLYVYDFLYMWCFFIDLVDVIEPTAGEKYPKLVRKYGKSPDQYAKPIDLDNDIMPSIPEIPPDADNLFPDGMLEDMEEPD